MFVNKYLQPNWVFKVQVVGDVLVGGGHGRGTSLTRKEPGKGIITVTILCSVATMANYQMVNITPWDTTLCVISHTAAAMRQSEVATCFTPETFTETSLKFCEFLVASKANETFVFFGLQPRALNLIFTLDQMGKYLGRSDREFHELFKTLNLSILVSL